MKNFTTIRVKIKGKRHFIKRQLYFLKSIIKLKIKLKLLSIRNVRLEKSNSLKLNSYKELVSSIKIMIALIILRSERFIF